MPPSFPSLPKDWDDDDDDDVMMVNTIVVIDDDGVISHKTDEMRWPPASSYFIWSWKKEGTLASFSLQ